MERPPRANFQPMSASVREYNSKAERRKKFERNDLFKLMFSFHLLIVQQFYPVSRGECEAGEFELGFSRTEVHHDNHLIKTNERLPVMPSSPQAVYG